MNLKAAKQLLKNIQEKDALDSCNNFLAAKTQLEYTEAAKTYKEYLATDYRSLDKQATELILTLGVHEPGKEADLTADLVLKGLAKLSKEERALQAELVSLVGGYRTAATEQKLTTLLQIKDRPSNMFYPSRALSGAEYHAYDMNLLKVSCEAEGLIGLILDSSSKITMCPATLSKVLYINLNDRNAVPPKISPSSYYYAAFVRPFGVYLARKSASTNIQGLKMAYSAVKRVFSTWVDPIKRTLLSVKSKVPDQLSSIQGAIQSVDTYLSLMGTIGLRFSHLKTTLHDTAELLQVTEQADEQLRYNFDTYLDRALELYERSKAQVDSVKRASNQLADVENTDPDSQDTEAHGDAVILKVAKDVKKAKQIAQFKAQKEAVLDAQNRTASVSDKLQQGAMHDMASYRAGIIELRQKLLEQEKKRQAELLLQYEREERKRREAAEADAAAVRPHVERSKERVLAPTEALLRKQAANRARAQLLANEGASRLFQTDLAIDGELVTMAGKNGIVRDNQENAISTIASELMAQYGILGTQYARDALAELRSQELAARFHHYSIRDSVASLFGN
ncbi:hypothetical protein GL50803_0016751 [Giardia duodenalis]|uniref:Uncharacterized protein n=1 Tax=Giardia intestinalis (strain ATCC 50803 / WB clone C6) TaxID=184922 RepID=A8B3S0_GIAIC|nr:hypothetical protein GL50803_0016751 [Giardia intestinalis]KAE8303223.1 hypothetical protein GL50803_0016751 [Giardia intestinalis]|eukprot:XP_001710295.1 Hypothetical protein GL50803_16751 [Giardia lamblia ATCC 50803]